MRGTGPRPVHGWIDGRLFASYHRPRGAVKNVGYVVCPALGYEAIQSYRTVLVLADELAGAGFHTIRLDYDGTGESLGTDEDPDRVAAWTGSIHRALDALAGLDQVQLLGLVGIRMGATLAARVAAEREVSRLVMWEPCPSGAMYVRELEILASASLGSLLSSGDEGSGAPADQPEGLESAGYLLTPSTVAELGELSLEAESPLGRPDTLVVQRDDRPANARVAQHFEGAGCDVEVQRRSGFKEMMVVPAKSVVPRETLEGIREWAASRSAAATGSESLLSLSPDVSDGTLRHRIVRFGPDQRLFGVLSEPDSQEGPTGSTVIFLAGGVVPRTAVNRMYVTSARDLAATGHAVLRFDVSGICESPPAPDCGPDDAYSPHLLADVTAAVTLAGTDGLPSDVRLAGLCSGAYAAFQVALREERVTGIALINPLVFYWREGLTLDSPTVQQFISARRDRDVPPDAGPLGKLAARLDLVHASRVTAARARTWWASRLGRAARRLGIPTRGLTGDMLRLLDRGVSVSLAYSEGDPGWRTLLASAGGTTDELKRAGVAVRVFPRADHTFSAFGVRSRLLSWIAETVA